jgi:3-phenylpropionate/cinnamic acid dioxygenase small subunit
VTEPSSPSPAVDLAEDRAALIDLVCAIAEALDRRQWDRFAGAFTSDAVGYGAVGPEAIAAQCRTYLDHCGPTQHLVASHRVTLDGDRARITSKARVFHQAADRSGSYEVFGVYLDQAERTPDGWRLTRRDFVPEIEVGDISVILGPNTPLHGDGNLL